MTTATIALDEYLRKTGLSLDGDFLRQAVQYLMQQLIELEAEQEIGAAKDERTPVPKTQGNAIASAGWRRR